MNELKVKLSHTTYPIFIKKGLFKEAGTLFRTLLHGKRAMIVTDSNLSPTYGKELLDSLNADGFEAGISIIPTGERSKSLDVLSTLYNSFAQFGITRNDFVIALGGGVTGDLSGFAASTWLRGTGFMQIPSSLLAMVDSSIGGKVAVNLPIGKNLVGAFYHPEIVLIDPLLLETLPERHFADGMAEVIKYGCIDDKDLFKSLESINDKSHAMENIEDIIYSCCDIKRKIVELDERETNLRMVLNFGHTIGHAIEKFFKYEKYTHGEAISLGMIFAADLSHMLGYCSSELSDRLRILLSKFNLPVQLLGINTEDIINTVLVDKKVRTNEINLILIKSIGNVIIEKFPVDRIGGFINGILNH